MIDIETDIFDKIANVVRAKFVGISVTSEAADLPAKFPAVTIIEQDNSVVQRMRTLNIENAANLMYEVNVYTNTGGAKKLDAKKIMATIDREFAKLNFTRTMCSPMPNLQEAHIYRMVARYTATVDRSLNIYQN